MGIYQDFDGEKIMGEHVSFKEFQKTTTKFQELLTPSQLLGWST